MKNHISKKLDIEDRREEIKSMLAQSMTQQEIAYKLNVERTTITKDIKTLKEEHQQFVYDLAKSDLAFYYMQCIQTVQEAERIIWETHRNKKQFSAAERKERYQIAKLIIAAAQARFPMFKDGPVFMTVKALEERLANIEFGKKGQGFSK